MNKLEEAKSAILRAICKIQHEPWKSEDVKNLAESYAILVSAETQELMTKHTISGCEHLDKEIIG